MIYEIATVEKSINPAVAENYLRNADNDNLILLAWWLGCMFRKEIEMRQNDWPSLHIISQSPNSANSISHFLQMFPVQVRSGYQLPRYPDNPLMLISSNKEAYAEKSVDIVRLTKAPWWCTALPFDAEIKIEFNEEQILAGYFKKYSDIAGRILKPGNRWKKTLAEQLSHAQLAAMVWQLPKLFGPAITDEICAAAQQRLIICRKQSPQFEAAR